MKVQHQIKTTISQQAKESPQTSGEGQTVCRTKEFDEIFTGENHRLVDESRRVHDSGSAGLDHPGQVRAGIARAQCFDGREGSDHVAQGTETNDEDSIRNLHAALPTSRGLRTLVIDSGGGQSRG